MKPRIGQRLSDEHREHAAECSYWREPLSNSGAGLEGDLGVDWQWVMIDPLGNKHTTARKIYEHSDGTITTEEHIADPRPNQHLGWNIEQGVWKSAGGDEDKPMFVDNDPPGIQELRWAIAEERMRIGAEPALPKIEPVQGED